jgi:hypothetical protein
MQLKFPRAASTTPNLFATVSACARQLAITFSQLRTSLQSGQW